MRTDRLDQYVWEEVRALLQEPERLSQEYQRRLLIPDGEQQSLQVLQSQIARSRKSIARLIDSYTEGYIEKLVEKGINRPSSSPYMHLGLWW